jgi:hypothetical protein
MSTTDHLAPRSLSINSIVGPAARGFALTTTALFSFEGMNRKWFVTRASSFSSPEEIEGEFLENCIEKNFHVSHEIHESGRLSLDSARDDKCLPCAVREADGAILR